MSHYRNYGHYRREKKQELPAGQVSMTLTQESEGVQVPPGTLLNSPAPSEDTWWVQSQKLPGEFWRKLGIKAVFYNRDTLEEFDWFDAPVGWRLHGSRAELAEKLKSHQVRFETFADQKKAREERNTAEAKRKEEEAVKRAEDDRLRLEFDAKMAGLTAGLFRIGNDWSVIDQLEPRETVLSWRSGENYKELVRATSKVTGKPAFNHPHGGYDDYRMDAFVDAETRDAAYTAWQIASGDTPEKAREWLEKYRGCVGADYYEWVAAR